MSSKDQTKQEIYDRYNEASQKLLRCVTNYNAARAALNEPNVTQGDYVVYAVVKDEWDKQSALVDEIGAELAKYRLDA
jgi:hypothetical protein